MTTLKTTSLIALFTGTLLSASVHAAGLTFLPVNQDGFVYEPTLSIIGGQLDPDLESVDASGTIGIELSFNCPLLATPTNGIRQQVSITSFDNDGLEMTSFEINPHYVIDMGSSFGLGFGPGIGVLSVDNGDDSDTVFTGQLGASAFYRTGTIYLGLEARQQYTGSIHGYDDVDNSRVSLKLGVDF